MKLRICTILLAGVLSAAAPGPVVWKLVDGPGRPIKPGGRFTVGVQATVQPGWHINSLGPIVKGRFPTRIWITQGQLFLAGGIVEPPDAIMIQDPTTNLMVKTYSGETSFTLPLRIRLSTDPGNPGLLVHVSYQACNDRTCLPPKEVSICMPIDIVYGQAPF
jgi:hypothetical protein